MKLHRKHLWVVGLALLAAGCGRDGSHRVSGIVFVTGGPVADLAGSTLEVALENDRTVRGFGLIEPDGRFELEALQNGAIRRRLPQGTYLVRILPNEADDDARERAEQAIAPRYLDFASSGLTFSVPAGRVTLEVAANDHLEGTAGRPDAQEP